MVYTRDEAVGERLFHRGRIHQPQQHGGGYLPWRCSREQELFGVGHSAHLGSHSGQVTSTRERTENDHGTLGKEEAINDFDAAKTRNFLVVLDEWLWCAKAIRAGYDNSRGVVDLLRYHNGSWK